MKQCESINPKLAPFLPLLETIATQFAPYCEVVLHDLSNLDCSLVAIGGNVTNRPLGAPITDYVLKLIKQYGDNVNNSYQYFTTTKDGKKLKSSTTFIRDTRGHIIGCFCINFSIDAFLLLNKMIQDLCTIPGIATSNETTNERFANDVGEVVRAIFDEVLKQHSIPPSQMDKSDKIKIVKELDEKGLFMVKGAIELVASQLGISKFTLYGYLDEIKKITTNSDN